MQCDDLRDDVLDILYGEASAETERRVAEHHAGCASCRDELAALRRLRRDLVAWRVPSGLRPALTPRARPARRLAAAAAVLLALGSLALARPVQRTVLAFAAAPGTRSLLAEQETRHRRELESLRADLERSAAARERVLLARVEEMVRNSEARQGMLLQARLGEFGQVVEAQRQYDLAQVSAGLTYLDGKSGLQAARTAELMGHLLVASQKK
jgi:anti-sigma factor RsiW